KEAIAMVHARYAKDGKGIYVITDQDSEFKRLAHWEPASNAFKFLTEQIKWDVETFDLSPNGSMIAFVVNEDGVGRLHLLATDPAAKTPKFELPAGSVTRIQWHNDGKALGFNIGSARSPADVYSLDLASGKTERWTQSTIGGLKAADFVEPEFIPWKTCRDRTISGFLYQPPAKFKGKRPVVIDIHG